MRFWDTSAVIALLVDEPASKAVLANLATDPALVVWWGTPVECQSAICRRERDGTFGPAQSDQARALLDELRASWFEVAPTAGVREEAELVLRRHPLRAADALQLGAARVWARGRPSGHQFCTLDDRMATIAGREGFKLALGHPTT
jgi:hypothetical protein